jgi:hypothetical protein
MQRSNSGLGFRGLRHLDKSDRSINSNPPTKERALHSEISYAQRAF